MPSSNYPSDYKRECYNCALNGHLNYIRVFQGLNDKAVVACDSLKNVCISDFSVFDRDYLDMPVSEEFLKSVNLPPALSSEPTLKLQHIEKLIWLNVLKPTIHSIVEHEKKWLNYCNAMRSFGLKLSEKIIPDADIVGLKNLNSDMINLGKLIIPDLDSIVESIQELHRDARIS